MRVSSTVYRLTQKLSCTQHVFESTVCLRHLKNIKIKYSLVFVNCPYHSLEGQEDIAPMPRTRTNVLLEVWKPIKQKNLLETNRIGRIVFPGFRSIMSMWHSIRILSRVSYHTLGKNVEYRFFHLNTAGDINYLPAPCLTFGVSYNHCLQQSTYNHRIHSSQ